MTRLPLAIAPLLALAACSQGEPAQAPVDPAVADPAGEGRGQPKPAAPAVAGTSLAAAPKPELPAPPAAAPFDFGRYELVQDKGSLERWVREAREQGFVAFDTETTSLHVIAVELCGVSLALAPGKACYVPLGHGGTTGDLLGGAVREAVPFSAYLFYKLGRHKFAPEIPADDWGEVLTPEAVVEEAKRMVAEYGFTSLKLKGGVLGPEPA